MPPPTGPREVTHPDLPISTSKALQTYLTAAKARNEATQWSTTPPRQTIPRIKGPPPAARKPRVSPTIFKPPHANRTATSPSAVPFPLLPAAQTNYDLTPLLQTLHPPLSSLPSDTTPIPALNWSYRLWDLLHAASDIEEEIVKAWLGNGEGGAVIAYWKPGEEKRVAVEKVRVHSQEKGCTFSFRWDTGVPGTRCPPAQGREVLKSTFVPLDFLLLPRAAGLTAVAEKEKGEVAYFLPPPLCGLVINQILLRHSSSSPRLAGPLPTLCVISAPSTGEDGIGGNLLLWQGNNWEGLQVFRAHGKRSRVKGGRKGPEGWVEGGGAITVVDLAERGGGFRAAREERIARKNGGT